MWPRAVRGVARRGEGCGLEGEGGVARRGEGCGLEGSFPSGVRGSAVFSRMAPSDMPDAAFTDRP